MSHHRFHAEDIPPLQEERPAQYAERLAQLLSSRLSTERRKMHGVYFTPVLVARFMATMITKPSRNHVEILDPGAGLGILTSAACEWIADTFPHVRSISVDAYEPEAALQPALNEVLRHTQEYLARSSISLSARIRTADLVLDHSEALATVGGLFTPTANQCKYDLTISNPPYFKLNADDERARAANAVVHGHPNIYSLFMAIGASLLLEGGQFIFITPRSFASGAYFERFRRWFFGFMLPERVHLFASRRQAFRRDDVLQETVILAARRTADWVMEKRGRSLLISSSHGVDDLASPTSHEVSLGSALDSQHPGRVLRIPVSEMEEEIGRLVHSWPGSLSKFGMEISTGPVVPFRAVSLLTTAGDVPDSHYPLLWMHHVHPMQIDWPNGTRKQQYVRATNEANKILVPDKNYVLLRRFTAKEEPRRLVAAPLLRGTLNSPLIGLENHLNYIHRPGGNLSEEEAWGLATLLNSRLLDVYIRTISGNTQINASDMRRVPLPESELILAIGRKVRTSNEPAERVDQVVEEMLANKHVD